MNDSGLDNKTKIDACLAIYKQQMEHYHSTQQVEWRVTIGTWALGAGAVALTFQQNVQLRPGYWLGLILLLPLAHMGWLLLIHASEEQDKMLWVQYRNEAARLIHVDYKAYTGRSILSQVGWLAAEAGPTLALATIFICRVVSCGMSN